MKNKILNVIIIVSILFCTVASLQAQEGEPTKPKTTKAKTVKDKTAKDKPKKEEVVPKEDKPVMILSGIEFGSYHSMANDIRKISSIPVEVITSQGSVYNFRRFTKSKFIDITFMQYDVLLYEQLNDLKHNTNFTKNVRILLPLGNEQIHLIAKTDSKINSIQDLKKKIVAIGSSEQGTNLTAKYIKEKTGIKWIDKEISLNESFLALLGGTIDAFFFVGSAPVAKLGKLPSTLKDQIKLVPIMHPELEKDYSPSKIPNGSYKWADYDVETYAGKFVLVTDIQHETDEKIMKVKTVLKDIQENISKLKSEGHPAWKEVDFKFEEFDDFDIDKAAKAVFNK